MEFPVILFIDGHSSHINVSVSEFCLHHNIILYCFPPHSSHILQPLDISVFGPLKKHWNDAINDFKNKFKAAVTKHSFFQVFDKAWKKSLTRNNCSVGFKAAGIVPFDANAVDYRKVLIRETSDRNHDSRRFDMNDDRRIAIARSFQAIRDILSHDQVELFEKRVEENYNIVDNSDSNKLWRIYKTVKAMQYIPSEIIPQNVPPVAHGLDKVQSSSNQTIQDIQDTDGSVAETVSNSDDSAIIERQLNLTLNSESAPQKVSVLSSTPEPSRSFSPIPDSPQAFSPMPGPSRVFPSLSVHSHELDHPKVTESTSSAISSVNTIPNESSYQSQIPLSETEEITYQQYPYSPFKKYLEMSQRMPTGNKKTAKNKPKTPSALSTKDYVSNLKAKQEKKQREAVEKEKRKRNCEEKKKLKDLQPSKRKKTNIETLLESSDESDRDEVESGVVYASSDEEEDLNVEYCTACEGKNDWEDGTKWIGCNTCPRWFHRTCLHKDFEKMTEEEI